MDSLAAIMVLASAFLFFSLAVRLFRAKKQQTRGELIVMLRTYTSLSCAEIEQRVRWLKIHRLLLSGKEYTSAKDILRRQQEQLKLATLLYSHTKDL
jgi:hypothetical protein